jgi:glycosyltransferase involved in cell wall biosynthesis
MRILINIPKGFGGVANYYLGLQSYWSEDVRYNTVGRRSRWRWSGLFWLPWDIIKYVYRIISWNPERIVLNPSFGYSAMKRDLLFMKVALILNRSIIIFIRGWDKHYADYVNKEIVFQINKCKCLIVLAEEFRKFLVSRGVKIPIHTMTTKVDDHLLQNFDINKRIGEIKTLLFLARVEKEKGVFIVIDMFSLLKQEYSNLKLSIVGDGTALNEVIKYTVDKNVHDVFFTGRLVGQDIAEQFTQSDIYIFPSYHGEGMPASVLEAMAFGLPVITRPVGGIIDFFTNSMGSLVESLNPDDYITEIERYINDPQLTKSISNYNYYFAKENFLASSVVKKIEHIFTKLE